MEKKTVEEIMTRGPACWSIGSSLEEVAKLMVDNDCGEIPVLDDQQRLLGVITDRDITCRVVARGLNPLELTAGHAMSSPVVSITPQTSLEEALRLLEQNQVRRLPVIEGAKVVGIVALADIAPIMAKRAAEALRQVSQPTSEPSGVAAAGPQR